MAGVMWCGQKLLNCIVRMARRVRRSPLAGVSPGIVLSLHSHLHIVNFICNTLCAVALPHLGISVEVELWMWNITFTRSSPHTGLRGTSTRVAYYRRQVERCENQHHWFDGTYETRDKYRRLSQLEPTVPSLNPCVSWNFAEGNFNWKQIRKFYSIIYSAYTSP